MDDGLRFCTECGMQNPAAREHESAKRTPADAVINGPFKSKVLLALTFTIAAVLLLILGGGLVHVF